MKIVINKCFGGYGLSVTALIRLIELKSETVKSFTPKEYYGDEDKWTKDFPSKFTHLEGGWYSYDLYCLVYNEKENLLYSDESRDKDEMRTNSTLIKVVEELGTEADGNFAELQVVDLPEGIEYEISNYDGIETVRESHRSW